MTAHPTFVDLSKTECTEILERNVVARIAYSFHDRVNIVPLHYRYADGWIYGRTSSGGKLEQILHNQWVAFEVDEIKGLFEWKSVVVHGAFYLVDPKQSGRDRAIYEEAVEKLRRVIPDSLDADDPVPFRNQVFRIHAADLTGRAAIPPFSLGPR